jgi:two-component system, sensor histidine kinase
VKPRRRPVKAAKASTPTLAALKRENAALRKTVRTLISRVERVVDDQGSPFSWFQAAAKLEETVRLRTEQYESLNARLTRELESRREIELALKAAKLQAEEANASKTRFLAAASHDLRQPLNSAVLFLESMDDAGVRQADLELLQRARVALSSLNNLLGTLLDVARLDSGGMQPQAVDFPVTALLERIGPEFVGVARSAGIELRFMPSSAWVRTDVHLLETVLRNFVSNAIRYTPAGRVLVGCRRLRQGLMLGVYDSGVGIEERHLQAIFEPYYQIPHQRRANGGIGLGLSIVSRIATLLGLQRVVRSRPGKGSLFGVVVPYGVAYGEAFGVVEGPRRRADARRASSRAARTTPLNVAVIDDSAEHLTGIKTILEKWGHRVVTAPRAVDAVVQLIAADLEPDLILSDYHLADGAKGDEAIREVQREFDRRSQALVMTSDPDPALRKRLESRGLAVLQKPLNLAKLRAMIERAAR